MQIVWNSSDFKPIDSISFYSSPYYLKGRVTRLAEPRVSYRRETFLPLLLVFVLLNLSPERISVTRCRLKLMEVRKRVFSLALETMIDWYGIYDTEVWRRSRLAVTLPYQPLNYSPRTVHRFSYILRTTYSSGVPHTPCCAIIYGIVSNYSLPLIQDTFILPRGA